MGDCLRSPDRGLRARAGEDAVFTSVPLRQTRSFRGQIRRKLAAGSGGGRVDGNIRLSVIGGGFTILS